MNMDTHGSAVGRSHERMISVLVVLGDVGVFGRLMGRLDEALNGVGHELLVVYDGGVSSIGEIEGICERLPGVRFVRSEGRGRVAALQTGIGAAAGDVVVMLNLDAEDEVGLIPLMAERVREGNVVVTPRPRRVGLVDWVLPVVAGMHVHDARTLFRAYWGEFLDGERFESGEGEAVGLELAVKGHWRERGVGEVDGNETQRTLRTQRTTKSERVGEGPYRREASWRFFASGFWHALQAPLFVWGDMGGDDWDRRDRRMVLGGRTGVVCEYWVAGGSDICVFDCGAACADADADCGCFFSAGTIESAVVWASGGVG